MAASLRLALQTLLLSSDHVSHKSHKFVGGTGETGWALPTRRVREVRGLTGAGANARNRHLGVSVDWLVNTAEEAEVLKTGKGYGEGLLWSVSEGVVGRAVPTERRQQKPVYEGIQQPGPRSSSLRHHSGGGRVPGGLVEVGGRRVGVLCVFAVSTEQLCVAGGRSAPPQCGTPVGSLGSGSRLPESAARVVVSVCS